MVRRRSGKPFVHFSWENNQIVTAKTPVLVLQANLLAELLGPAAWQARMLC